MALITYFILLELLRFATAGDCQIDNISREIRWEKKLRKDIKCNYEVFVPPKPAKSGPLRVSVSFILKYFTFNSDEEVFTLQTWMFIRWTDDRLKWDPAKYDGINETEISSATIWTPSFRLYNSADSNDFDRFFYVRCHLKSTGQILCLPKVTHKVKCKVKLTDYPYDAQECTLKFGAWTTKYMNINMSFSSRAMSMWGAEYGTQWFISDYKQETQQGLDRQLNMTLTLQREALSLAAVIVYPSLIISGLTVVSLFLDVRSNVRLMMVSFSIFSHYYWLAELGDNIPKGGTDPPKILLFYRGSMVLTIFVLLTTFVLDIVCKKKTEPLSIIGSINGFVYNGYVKFLVFSRWDVDCEMLTEENKFSEDWTNFAYIVNILCSITTIISYIGLYFTFMPQQYL